MSNMELERKQIGPYSVEAEIGQGRMGVVYRATDTIYDRPVALKILSSDFTRDLRIVRQFVSAGREAMRLRHPNIVQVYDAGQADGQIYIAMAFVEGDTLARRLAKQHGPLPWDMAQPMLQQIAAGLDYAHARGFIHGDLKPANIFLTTGGQALVADFGAALPLANPDNMDGALSLPLAWTMFISPEQARGEESLSARSDIYSLGTIAYQVFAGQLPFQSANPLALLRRIIEEQPTAPDLINADLPLATVRALQKVLTKTPADRYPTAGAFVRALSGNEPEEAAVASGEAVVTRDIATSPQILSQAVAPLPYAAKPRSQSPGPIPLATKSLKVIATSIPATRMKRWADRALRRLDLAGFAVLVAGALLVIFILIAIIQSAGKLVAHKNSGEKTPGSRSEIALKVIPSATPIAGTRQSTPLALSNASGLPTATVTRAATAIPTPVAVRVTAVPGRTVLANALNPQSVVVAKRTDGAATRPRASATGVLQTKPTPKPTPTLPPTWTPTQAPTFTPTITPMPTATDTPVPTTTPAPVAVVAVTAGVELVKSNVDVMAPVAPQAQVTSPIPVATVAPPLSGRIAYAMWNPHTDRPDMYFWEIRTGTNSVPVRDRRQPDFSIHNDLVANAEGGGIDNLVRMGQYGERPWVISEHPEDAHPHWSPDGKMVVFDSAQMGDRQHRIYLLTDLQHRHEVPPLMYQTWEIFGRYPVFIADGRIAYNGCNYWKNGGVCGIYVVDTQGGKPANATQWPGDIPTDNLGSRILFMSNRLGNSDVYSMNPDGTDLQQLTRSPGRDGLATASPDGNYIAFLTDREGPWAIYVMRTDGSDPHRLFILNGGYGSGDYDWYEDRLSWGR